MSSASRAASARIASASRVACARISSASRLGAGADVGGLLLGQAQHRAGAAAEPGVRRVVVLLGLLAELLELGLELRTRCSDCAEAAGRGRPSPRRAGAARRRPRPCRSRRGGRAAATAARPAPAAGRGRGLRAGGLRAGGPLADGLRRSAGCCAAGRWAAGPAASGGARPPGSDRAGRVGGGLVARLVAGLAAGRLRSCLAGRSCRTSLPGLLLADGGHHLGLVVGPGGLVALAGSSSKMDRPSLLIAQASSLLGASRLRAQSCRWRAKITPRLADGSAGRGVRPGLRRRGSG